ncbi:arabinose ABC transporter substrate-binding protein [Lichenihabitans sp. PAMC28606]|uniref:arabinose ABC transporter substrate-binding protein n=1 Tax=Lichenihabitans sp. PAMC28606 TaxID=2880932 RepID=UPI001D0A7240|nr:arabinose ABC transporter substrate-binding protein [Lichenihabitans sp. PAMC28606]UDL94568.1 arabinose ABC transporter substrate-binding protein [Lichenihabitans sp. PAMC28606]
MKRAIRSLTLAGLMAGSLLGSAFAADTKIGFVVKQPEEPWFQDEWKFADQAGKEKGFTVVKIGAEDGEKALAAIDNLGAQGAQGFIICTPDVNLGPALAAKAQANKLKMMTVDDRLVDGAGKPLEAVPHMGISASKIGELVGQTIAEQTKARGWDLKDLGVIRVSYDQLPTAKDRVDGATAMLLKAGLPQANIFNAPQDKTDTEAALNAATTVINAHPDVKHWAAIGLNDEAVLGAVRATESVGIKPADVIGVGIGGADSAINEFKKSQPTGFVATVIISPKRHGYETATDMFDWITKDQMPPTLTQTAGQLATRDDYAKVRQGLGIQ